jgi:Alpha/beta hydrolase family
MEKQQGVHSEGYDSRMPPEDSPDHLEENGGDIVLLIHGTGAGAVENDGEAWWQRESKFWRFLQGRLENRASIQPAGRVFHWSGDNSEQERRSAGRKLAAWLSEFEKDCQPYHLIGHSHGGSVIWRAVNEAAAKGCSLSQLRSCTTVGTPFFRYSPKPLSSWAMFPILTSLFLIIGSAYSGYAYFEHVRDVFGAGDWATLVALPFLWVGSALILAWWIGPLVTWLLASRELRRDRKVEQKTAELCSGRFTSISAPLDEAINGLTTTLSFEGDLVPRNATRFRWFRSIYNNIIARGADEFVWDRGSSRLQGNDCGGFALTNVLRAPISEVVPVRLPQEVESRMVVQANQNAASTIAGIREVLGLAAVSGWHMPKLAAGFRSSVNWGELIHTSYFSVPEVAATRTSSASPSCSTANPTPLSG